jgi:hypothetical protein
LIKVVFVAAEVRALGGGAHEFRLVTVNDIGQHELQMLDARLSRLAHGDSGGAAQRGGLEIRAAAEAHEQQQLAPRARRVCACDVDERGLVFVSFELARAEQILNRTAQASVERGGDGEARLVCEDAEGSGVNVRVGRAFVCECDLKFISWLHGMSGV